ncbi:MAG: hypothetical protein RLN72_03370 [Henriciella sp.]
MTRFDHDRRRLLQLAGMTAAVPLFGCAGAQSSDGSGVRAIGQPMPGSPPLPETPPQQDAADSVGIAVIGLGGFALYQMMPNFVNARRAHIAAVVSGKADKAKPGGEA